MFCTLYTKTIRFFCADIQTTLLTILFYFSILLCCTKTSFQFLEIKTFFGLPTKFSELQRVLYCYCLFFFHLNAPFINWRIVLSKNRDKLLSPPNFFENSLRIYPRSIYQWKKQRGHITYFYSFKSFWTIKFFTRHTKNSKMLGFKIKQKGRNSSHLIKRQRMHTSQNLPRRNSRQQKRRALRKEHVIASRSSRQI